mmetsp:Transcript_10259/g.27319  ORF Transcript_10259/g.27319 Transcript_10259/m.27319 type:complete len:133 (-) Transcript_10259:9-407(-)
MPLDERSRKYSIFDLHRALLAKKIGIQATVILVPLSHQDQRQSLINCSSELTLAILTGKIAVAQKHDQASTTANNLLQSSDATSVVKIFDVKKQTHPWDHSSQSFSDHSSLAVAGGIEAQFFAVSIMQSRLH